MFVLLSPAKTLDLVTPLKYQIKSTQPHFLEQSVILMDGLKKMNVSEVELLMKISPKLANLNVKRFQEWSLPLTIKNARPAIFTFKGDVYQGLDTFSLSLENLNVAQKKIGILSGLYGFLKPFDLIKPYRLEMGTSYENPKGKNLYSFWGSQIVDFLEKEYSAIWINLASEEYFKVVSQIKINTKKTIITPIFKDEKNGKSKIISFYAKKARGLMARYIIKNNITNSNDLQSFQEGGYLFDSKQSTQEYFTFIRPEIKNVV